MDACRVAGSEGVFWPKSFWRITALILWLGSAAVGSAADPYASALDRRFVSGSQAPESVDPHVATLEAGLKTQAMERSQASRANAPLVVHGEPVVLWKMVIACGIGLIALVALSNWHRWRIRRLAKKRRKRVIAKDPILAELATALNPDSQMGPVGATNLNSVPPAVAQPASGEAQPSPPVTPNAPAIAEIITQMAEAFHTLNRSGDELERLALLRELLAQVQAAKEAAGLTQLRSVWLLTTGLLGLLKQFSIQPANMSTSALRTAAAAIDSLEFVSTRCGRDDLLTNPPIRLLCVDDDAVSRRAIALALQKIFTEPDVAPDGPTALAMAGQLAYDVIFLDIEMPGMDGFEACSKIHQTPANRGTPIVFVTNHHDFDSRAKSALAGAHELIAKPFLAFEIALKAITLVLKTRQERERGGLSQAQSRGDRVPGAAPVRPSFLPGVS